MNTPYQPRQPKPFGAVSELLMAFLLIIALVQIAVCFQAGAGLVRENAPTSIESRISAVTAPNSVAHPLTGLTNASFQSAPHRG